MGNILGAFAFMPQSREPESPASKQLCSIREQLTYLEASDDEEDSGINIPARKVEIRVYDPPSNPAVSIVFLYAHGNAQSIGSDSRNMRNLSDALGATFVEWEYPGYADGESKWVACEQYANFAAVEAYDWVARNRPGSFIIPWGYSLGASFACHIARERKVHGLVLQSAFTSFWGQLLGTDRLPANAFKNHEMLKQSCASLEAGVVLIHGAEDATVSSTNSLSLMKTCSDAGVVPNSTSMQAPLLYLSLIHGRGHVGFSLGDLTSSVTPLIRRVVQMHKDKVAARQQQPDAVSMA